MKAAVYHGPRDIRVEELPMPAIADDEVLVRVVACGISGADLHLYRLGMMEDLGRPVEGGRVMGHELAGEIAAVGASVKDFKPGDRIAGLSFGRAGLGGGFAEYVAVKLIERGPFHLPEGVSFEEGATLEPLATAIHGVDLARPERGEAVVVLGAGAIGLSCLQVLRATCLCRVIVVDASPRRLAITQALGADAVVDLTATDPVETVIELTGGAKPLERFQVRSGNADAVIDCAGAQASPDQGLRMSLSERFERHLMPLIEFLMGIPALALVVLIIIWVPFVELRIFVVLLLVCFPFFTIQILDGIKGVSKDLIEMLRAFRPTRRQLFAKLILPGVVPAVLTSWKLTIAYGTRAVIIAELVGTTSGIGNRLLSAQEKFEMDDALAWTLALVAFLWASQSVLTWLERRLLRWRPAALARVEQFGSV